MEIAMLVLTVLGVIAAIIAALPPLGVDVRLFGRPNMPLEGIPYFRARQAWIAIAVALISLGVSAGAFYYFFRPRVVEKIVEKPVDRIVEKVVEKDCPKSAPVSKPKQTTPHPAPTMSQECPGGECAQSSGQSGGITAGKLEINTPPARQLTEVQKQGIKEFLQTVPQSVLITVGSVYGSGDGDIYANEFFPLFDGRHYDHQSAAAIRTGFPREFTGVFVATATEDDPATQYRDALAKKLVNLGINARVSKGSKIAPGNLELLVGYRLEEVKP